MKTANKKISIELATKLMQSDKGMIYPNTNHNRKMIAKVSHNILKELQAKRKLKALI